MYIFKRWILKNTYDIRIHIYCKSRTISKIYLKMIFLTVYFLITNKIFREENTSTKFSMYITKLENYSLKMFEF